jgi:hypothetical protein
MKRRLSKQQPVESVADFKARLCMIVMGRPPINNKAHACVVRKGKPTYGYNQWEKNKQ